MYDIYLSKETLRYKNYSNLKFSKSLFFSNFTLILLLILGLSSFFYIDSDVVVDYKNILEIFFLLIAISLIFKLKKNIILISLISFFYLIYTLSLFFIKDTPATIYDYLLMYKAFIYVFFLSFFVGKRYFKETFLRKLFNILLTMFLIKYTIMIALGHYRPTLFTENNFELMMILIIYIGVISQEVFVKKRDLFLLLIIFLLSGSRSGILAFFVLLLFINYGNSLKFKIIKFLFFLVGTGALVLIYNLRLGESTVEDIDRIKFLFHFLYEIRNWNILNYLFGAPFMTPMSYETAQALSYYTSLFSDPDKLLAYSVVLHSFVLRTVFDHGFLGLFFLFYSVFSFLKYSGFNNNAIFLILSILFINGLSVSSLNSIFVTIALGFIMLSNKKNYNTTRKMNKVTIVKLTLNKNDFGSTL